MLEHRFFLDEDGYYYEEIDGEVTKKITTKDEFAVVNPAPGPGRNCFSWSS